MSVAVSTPQPWPGQPDAHQPYPAEPPRAPLPQTETAGGTPASLPELLSREYPAGTVRGIPIVVHATLPLFFAAQFLCSRDWDTASVLGRLVVGGPVLFGTVLCHELGHAMACRRVGGTAQRILLWPLGGLAYIAHDAGERSDMLVTIAGPATHVPQALVWLVLAAASNEGHGVAHGAYNTFALICLQSMWLNLLLLCFNLFLPAYPLDGGRLLVDALLLRGWRMEPTARAAGWASAALAVALACWGVVAGNVLMVFVAAWIGKSALDVINKLKVPGAIAFDPMFGHLPPARRQELAQPDKQQMLGTV